MSTGSITCAIKEYGLSQKETSSMCLESCKKVTRFTSVPQLAVTPTQRSIKSSEQKRLLERTFWRRWMKVRPR